MTKIILFSHPQDDSTIFLNTLKTENAYTKAKTSDLLQEEGMLAEFYNNQWNFSPWKFTEPVLSSFEPTVYTQKDDETVLLKGSGFKGKSLKDILELEPTEENLQLQKKASITALESIEAAIKTNLQKYPNNGAGGIFIADDFSKVLFLPQENFERSVELSSAEHYSANSGFYIFRKLSKLKAVRFTQSVIAYRILTGKFPFANTDSVKRYEDFIDHNFDSLTLNLFGAPEDLTAYIDGCLSRSPEKVVYEKARYGDKRNLTESILYHTQVNSAKKFNRTESKNSELLQKDFPIAQLKEFIEQQKNCLEQIDSNRLAELKKAAEKEKSSRAKRIKRLRFWKTNWPRFAASAVMISILSLFYIWIADDMKERTTTKGLTSFQVAELFMSGINTANVLSIQAATGGRAVGNTTEAQVSNIYVAAQTRAMMNKNMGTYSPAEWLIDNNNGQCTIFGVSQLKIDGKPARLMATGPIVRDKLPPVTREDGTPFQEGEKVKHSVEYQLLITEYPIVHHNLYRENLIFIFHKGKWELDRITQDKENIDAINNSQPFSYDELYKDYKEAMELFQGDLVKTCDKLLEKYDWISTNQEVMEAMEHWNLTHKSN